MTQVTLRQREYVSILIVVLDVQFLALLVDLGSLVVRPTLMLLGCAC